MMLNGFDTLIGHRSRDQANGVRVLLPEPAITFIQSLLLAHPFNELAIGKRGRSEARSMGLMVARIFIYVKHRKC